MSRYPQLPAALLGKSQQKKVNGVVQKSQR